MGLTDGLASLEVNATTLSGTNIFGASVDLGSGTVGTVELAVDAITATTISGLTISTAKIAANAVTTAKLASNAASGAAVSAEYSPVHAEGNPGNSIQAGSTQASDISVNVTFDTAFALEPRVVLTPAESGALATQSYIGSTETTGFIWSGQSGLVHNYIAIGSGRI